MELAGLVAGLVFLSMTGMVIVPAHAATPLCFGKQATIVGTAGPDDIVGTPGPDVIGGGGGNDLIWGDLSPYDSNVGGNDLICGFTGADTLRGSWGNDKLNGGDGDDSVRGDFGADVVQGKAGNDHVEGDFGETGSDYGSGDHFEGGRRA